MRFENQPTDQSIPQYHAGTELANAATHGAGLLLSLFGAAAIFLSSRYLDTGMTIAIGVYVVTMVIVYAVSTLSHAINTPRAKHVLRVWDQGLIYLFISGTYTPLIWAFMTNHMRWIMLAVVWIVALIGFCFKIVGEHRVNAFSAVSYILLGWVPAMAVANWIQLSCFVWIILGGLSYTLGVFFLIFDHKRHYFHPAWHICVIIGSACHYYAIYVYVLLGSMA